MKKTSSFVRKILLMIAIFTPVLLFAQQEKIKPEKVYYLTKRYMPKSWYEQQAELWRSEVGKDPKNGEAWHNYYMATEYSYLEEGSPAERDAKLTKILNDMQFAIVGEALPDLHKFLASQKQESKLEKVFFTETGPTDLAKSIPGLYEFLVLKWRNDHQNIGFLKSAYQLRPEDPETYDDLIIYYETNGDEAKVRELCEKLYQSQDMATELIDYNYNILMSTEKNAILFTNGDNDTFPIWLLQRAKSIRPDVTVLNAHMIRQQDYLKRLLKAKNVAVDLAKLPDQDVYRCIPEFCKAIAAVNPAIPIYFALTVDKSHTKSLANNLYVTGLASRYSPRRLDNLALLQDNVENHFRLDYLKYDWYSETNISSESIKELNVNYVASFIMLSEHYEKSGENKKAEYWKNFALDLAKAANDQALIEHIKNRKVWRKDKEPISLK